MRTAKTLIRLGRCPGWSKPSLGAESLCWFCHVAAQIMIKACDDLEMGQQNPLELLHGFPLKQLKYVWIQIKMVELRLKMTLKFHYPFCPDIVHGKCFQPKQNLVVKRSLTSALVLCYKIGVVLQSNCKSELSNDKTNKMACGPSEDFDQPGHPPSLIWVFAGRTVILLVLSWGGSDVNNKAYNSDR